MLTEMAALGEDLSFFKYSHYKTYLFFLKKIEDSEGNKEHPKKGQNLSGPEAIETCPFPLCTPGGQLIISRPRGDVPELPVSSP